MVDLNGNKNLEKFNDELKRKVNTELEREKDKEDKINKKVEELLNSNHILEAHFLKNFNYMCKKRGIMTGKDGSELLEISEQTFSGYKNGTKFPKLHQIEFLAEKLNTSAGYLLGYTDNTSPILEKANMIQGLSEEARICLYVLSHNIHDDFPDIDATFDLQYSEDDIEFLDTFSSFISDFSNFCYFLSYINRYVKLKQEKNNLDTDEENSNKLQIEKLDDDLLRNRGKITKDNN